jgi:transposase
LLRAGTINEAMHDAAKDFQADFIVASRDPLRALPTLRVPGTGREPDLNERQLDARRRVPRALEALGGLIRIRVECVGLDSTGVPMVMDRACEGDETRQLVLELGCAPVVPPHPNRRHPWIYDRNLDRRRTEVERLFRGLKGFRCIFSRFEKLDRKLTALIHFALIIDIICVNTA